jgi:colanic acid biosynthesis glycosyl transferase WcaI
MEGTDKRREVRGPNDGEQPLVDVRQPGIRLNGLTPKIDMRLLLITTYYPPDPAPSAVQFGALCEDLVRLGHQVSVISTVPHYPDGKVWPGYRGRLAQRVKLNGVDVTRVWVPTVDRARLGQRAATFIAFQSLATLSGLRRHYDLLLVSNPALESFLPFLVLGVLRRKPAIFSVHDLYPDVGIKLGIFRHPTVIRMVAATEQFCLDAAVCVRVLSEGFREPIRERGVPDSKIAVLWDWIDTQFLQPRPRINAFSTQHNLNDCFTVLYVGNIGLSQGLQHVLTVAGLLADRTKIRFVFVGDGAGREPLLELARGGGLTNVQFINFQARERLPDVFASGDICLICLKRGIGSDSVPSKFYSILACGRPLVASVDPASDTWNLTKRAGCGLCVEPEDPQALAGAILHLYRDERLREQFAANGRNYVMKLHSRASAAQEFHQLLLSLVPEGGVPRPEAAAQARSDT